MSAATLKVLKSKAVTRGGLDLYAPDAAVALLKAAEKEGIRVLGIDGFYIGENTTRPSLENSVDLSDSGDSVRDALNFLGERQNSGLYFEVVLEARTA